MAWFESLISLFIIKTATHFARSHVKVRNLILSYYFQIGSCAGPQKPEKLNLSKITIKNEKYVCPKNEKFSIRV